MDDVDNLERERDEWRAAMLRIHPTGRGTPDEMATDIIEGIEAAKAAIGAGVTCYLEVEVYESRRRYLTIEVTPELAEKICEWTMKYNPTAEEELAAIAAVKAAKVLNEEIMHDTYELGTVDFTANASLSHGDESEH
jgi:hypothetical protein